jgi:hypothetical protein
MKDYAKALGAVDRALALGYGPRKLGIYRTKASILEAAGRRSDAIVTLREAVTYGESLPPEQRYPLAGVKRDLAKVEAAPGSAIPGAKQRP